MGGRPLIVGEDNPVPFIEVLPMGVLLLPFLVALVTAALLILLHVVPVVPI